MSGFHAECGRRGLVENPTKSFDLELSATALGMEVHEGVALLPRSSRVCDLLAGSIDLLEGATASPLELASFGGVVQWHNLVNRPLFSCLHEYYAFVRQPEEKTERAVPACVLSELALNVGLLALWSTDLTRPWLPCMPATDASGSYGFGYCLAPCSPELAREVAAHAAGHDHHIRLTLAAGDPAELPRAGRELRLPLRRSDFKRVLAVRAKKADHSGALEASAVVLGMRRLARRQRWHRHRGVFLVDAQAVLAALQKGRSSAPTLRHPVKQAGAISLACGWRWRYAYLPSESNPADDPSRGVKPKVRQRKTGKDLRCPVLNKLCGRTRQALRVLRRDHRVRDWHDDGLPWPLTSDSDSCAACLL